MQTGGNEIFCERKEKCCQLKETVMRICGVFRLFIPTSNIEKTVISLDEDDNSEQSAAEPSYFLQPLYLLSKHHILKKFFLVLRSFVKAVRKKRFMWTFMIFMWRWKEPHLMLLSHKLTLTSVLFPSIFISEINNSAVCQHLYFLQCCRFAHLI